YPKPLPLPYLCYLCVLLFKNPFPERSPNSVIGIPVVAFCEALEAFRPEWNKTERFRSKTERPSVPQIHCTMVQKRCKLGATLRKQPSLHPCLQFCGNTGAVVGAAVGAIRAALEN